LCFFAKLFPIAPFCKKRKRKKLKKMQKTIDKQEKKVYNTIENKAGLSALTYLQQGSRVNKRLMPLS
jgi:hypothetical protein